MSKAFRTEMPRPNTVWSALADFDHDYLEEAGTRVHSFTCRRCRLELLLRQVTNQLGTPPDCPPKPPVVGSDP
jgi:hypothetical protein